MTTMLPTEPGHSAPGVTDQESNLELKEVEGLSQGQIVRKRFFRHRGALVSMVVLALIIITAFTSVGVQFGDFKSGGWWMWSWNSIAPIENGSRPTLSLWPLNFGNHPFGQDEVGRDIFAVVMRGTQQSLQIMVIVGLIATTIGTVVGSVTGYFRGWVDSVLMRFTDIVITIPVIVIGAVLGRTYGIQGAGVLGIILGLVFWTGMSRLVRGEFLSLREREFVDAARVAGASDARIMFRHILPNAVGVIIVNATLLMAAAILIETGAELPRLRRAGPRHLARQDHQREPVGVLDASVAVLVAGCVHHRDRAVHQLHRRRAARCVRPAPAPHAERARVRDVEGRQGPEGAAESRRAESVGVERSSQR